MTTYFAVDNKGYGQYIEADSWEAAEAICVCNGLDLIGAVIFSFELPEIN